MERSSSGRRNKRLREWPILWVQAVNRHRSMALVTGAPVDFRPHSAYGALRCRMAPAPAMIRSDVKPMKFHARTTPQAQPDR